MGKLPTSTLSAKGQTVPAQIRRGLGIRPGDTTKYEVEDGEVRICKAETIDIELAPVAKGYSGSARPVNESLAHQVNTHQTSLYN